MRSRKNQPEGRELGETWLVRMSRLEPLVHVYGGLAKELESFRRGEAPRRVAYHEIVVPMLALSAAIRLPLGVLAALLFVVSFVVARLTGPSSPSWLDLAGLAVGWLAAIGVLTCVLRMGLERMLRKKVDLLVRSRLVEPLRHDMLWQSLVALAAAIMWHLQK